MSDEQLLEAVAEDRPGHLLVRLDLVFLELRDQVADIPGNKRSEEENLMRDQRPMSNQIFGGESVYEIAPPCVELFCCEFHLLN